MKRFEITQRIGFSFDHGVVEVPNHKAKSLLVPDLLKCSSREPLFFCAVLSRDVAKAHFGVRGFLGREHAGERVDSSVRYSHGAEADPTGTSCPVIALNTVVFPDPANPTKPIFIPAPCFQEAYSIVEAPYCSLPS